LTTPQDTQAQAELFVRLAADYDRSIRTYQPTYDAMLDLSTDLARVGAPGRSRCLDFGTGTGAALPRLGAMFDELVAIEPGHAMLELARARMADATTSPAVPPSFIEGTIDAPAAKALADASFDAVHCSLVLMFLAEDADKQRALEFFHRLLRPGGVVVLTELCTDADAAAERTTWAQWTSLMRHRGADDATVTAAEGQIHAAMHRRTPDQLRSFLERAGFGQVQQPFQALHTRIFVATR
jgi:ubiquinone/menaquinone biosynthesis C-methylase UbiE